MNLEISKLVEQMILNYFENEDEVNATRREDSDNPDVWKDTVRTVIREKDRKENRWEVELVVFGRHANDSLHAHGRILERLYGLQAAEMVEYIGIMCHTTYRSPMVEGKVTCISINVH